MIKQYKNKADQEIYEVDMPSMTEIVDQSGILTTYEYRSADKINEIKTNIEKSFTAISNDLANIENLRDKLKTAIENLNGNWESSGATYTKEKLMNEIYEPLETDINYLNKYINGLGNEKILTTPTGNLTVGNTYKTKEIFLETTFFRNCTKIEPVGETES